MSTSERLYTPELLSLTLELGNFPLRADLPLQGAARSKSCGSTLMLGLELDDKDVIAAIGMRVQACAIGQATAALFGEFAMAKAQEELVASRLAMKSWLEGSAQLPDIHRIDLLERAKDYPARHGAMMLAWDAALDALSSIPSTR